MLLYHHCVGMYFIDPNLGSSEDSLKTYCNFDSTLTYTCVQVLVIYAHSISFKMYAYFNVKKYANYKKFRSDFMAV